MQLLTAADARRYAVLLSLWVQTSKVKGCLRGVTGGSTTRGQGLP